MAFGVMHDSKTHWVKDVNSLCVHVVGGEENSEFLLYEKMFWSFL